MPALPKETQDLIPTVGVGTVTAIDTMNGVKLNHADVSPFARAALRFQKEQDDVAIDNAKADVERYITETAYGTPDENGVLQGGWRSLYGYNALRPDDNGKGLSQRVDEGLAEKIKSVGATLSASARKKFMENYAIQRRHDVYNNTSSFVLQQNDVYKKSSAEGNVKSAQQNAAVSIANPDVFARDLAIVEENARKYGTYMGQSPEDINNTVRVAQSQAITAGLSNLLQVADKTPQQAYEALDVLNSYSSKMTADDVVKMRGQIQEVIDKENKASFVSDGAKKLVYKAGIFGKGVYGANSANTAEGLFSHIVGIESNGAQFDPKTGKTIVGRYPDGTTPPVGQRAFGVSQMQIATAKEAAERMGIKFDPERFMTDRAYNFSLGVGHFSSLITRYGDPDLAAAAYHQGVGNVDKAIKRAGREGGTWFNYLGKGGQDYVTKFRKRRQAVMRGNASSGINIFSPDGFKKYERSVTYDDCEKMVKEELPLANLNSAYAVDMADSLYAQVGKLQRDEVTRLKNGALAIMDYAVEHGYDLSRLPMALKNEVNPDVFAQLTTRIKALQKLDTSGDRELATRLMNDDEMLAGMEDTSFKLALYSLPADMRQKVQDRRWALQQKQVVAEHGQAVDVRNAQAGKYNKDNVLKAAQANSLLERAMGPEQWKKLDKNQQAWTVANFVTFYAENQTTGNRSNNGVEDLTVAKNWLNNEYDINGWIIDSKKNYATLKIGDLPSGQVGNVREICTALAKGMTGKEDPSDNEVVDAFIRLDSMRYPDISGLTEGMLSEDRVNWVVAQYRQANGGRLPNDIEIVKYYVRSIMNGEEVPTKEETTGWGDRFFGAIGVKPLDGFGDS